MKIFYVCPDFALPSGGVKVLYRQVEILRAHQFEAYIMHVRKGFQPDWFPTTAPIVYMDDNPPIWPGDTLVIPETGTDFMKQFRDAPLKRVIIALNPHYIFKALPDNETWRDYNIDGVITSSEIMADFIRWSMAIENVVVISTAIEPDLFFYAPSQKKLQIAYMSRKDTATPLIEKIFKAKKLGMDQFKFIPVGNLSMPDYAAVLRQSHLYLTTSPYEGTNLSVLEAMACGCLCLGYDGIGGKEYIVGAGPQQNFILAETMNYIDLAKLLYDAVQRLNRQDLGLNRVRQNALATAARFTPAREEQAIVNFWSHYVEKTISQPVSFS
ncbi:MAG TPA: glycosyltransferase family 4 protein [Anaerolineae bacterium]|nr:glycosyltransferase family 4 protein [Anaerolineae bacterium]HMR64449.1 glycosyltransferase family 4 protein [Anaerolineae bacterium]